MKVFISWSGDRSREVAEFLNGWIPLVLQAVQPWISTEHIDRGATWVTEIQQELQDTSFGIVCLTRDNKANPWILFEAGSFAKGISRNRVCPLLIDLTTNEVEYPLAQFNLSECKKDSVLKLMKTLNGTLQRAVSEMVLEEIFELSWPKFEERLTEILAKRSISDDVPARSDKELLLEILDTTRSLAGRVSDMEGFLKGSAIAATVKERLGRIGIERFFDGYSGSPDVSGLGPLKGPSSGQTLAELAK